MARSPQPDWVVRLCEDDLAKLDSPAKKLLEVLHREGSLERVADLCCLHTNLLDLVSVCLAAVNAQKVSGMQGG